MMGLVVCAHRAMGPLQFRVVRRAFLECLARRSLPARVKAVMVCHRSYRTHCAPIRLKIHLKLTGPRSVQSQTKATTCSECPPNMIPSSFPNNKSTLNFNSSLFIFSIKFSGLIFTTTVIQFTISINSRNKLINIF